MINVLITGATGNVGLAVIKSLQNLGDKLNILACIKDIESEKFNLLPDNIELKVFDFHNSNTFLQALDNCDILFLMRPPQISEVEKYFEPIINSCKIKNVKHIIFLSVQGVEKK